VSQLKAYQKRDYDTVSPFFDRLGYTDAKIEELLKNTDNHDVIFALSPASRFFDTLIRHTIRNRNNSRPAHKFVKRKLSSDTYVLDPIDITYHINTYPLTLSEDLLTNLSVTLGESFGVNIRFLNKNPSSFDAQDWSTWLGKIDCYYFDNLGRFTRGDVAIQKQHDLELVGAYVFARKRWEREVIPDMHGVDFEKEVQMFTAQFSILCDFNWLQNNDVRLTDDLENIPVDSPDLDKEDGTPS
jgi:hypothetical protein